MHSISTECGQAVVVESFKLQKNGTSEEKSRCILMQNFCVAMPD